MPTRAAGGPPCRSNRLAAREGMAPGACRDARRGGAVALDLDLYQQDGDVYAVLDAVSGGAEEHVGEEAVAVRAHRDQVALALADPAHDLGGRVAEGELGLGGDAVGFEFLPHRFEVGAVV